LLTEKARLLSDDAPRCRLTRTAVDLADPGARDAFFDQALDGVSRALVLTEGLLYYLDDHAVHALSEAIERPEVAWWMLDFGGPGLKRLMNKRMGGILENAPFKFAPKNGLAYFEELGWRTVEVESSSMAARRFRPLPLSMRLVARLPQPDPRRPGARQPYSAVARLTH